MHGSSTHLANRIRHRLEARETQKAIAAIARIKGVSEEQLAGYKKYYADLLKTPPKQRTKMDDLLDQYLGRWTSRWNNKEAQSQEK